MRNSKHPRSGKETIGNKIIISFQCFETLTNALTITIKFTERLYFYFGVWQESALIIYFTRFLKIRQETKFQWYFEIKIFYEPVQSITTWTVLNGFRLGNFLKPVKSVEKFSKPKRQNETSKTCLFRFSSSFKTITDFSLPFMSSIRLLNNPPNNILSIFAHISLHWPFF